MKRIILVTLILAIFSIGSIYALAEQKIVIQYDCIPNYANWGGVTKAYKDRTGVVVPPDMKGSSPSMAALEAERNSPKADCVYYSGAIGYQATSKGLHDSYKPRGWEKIPSGLKDPNGTWWTVHTGHIAFLINTTALKGRPIPKSFADLLNPMYKGMIAYDDPRFNGTGFTFVAGINAVLGGGKDLNAGFGYLKKLDANILKYNKDNIYNDLLRGEVPIWINADGNGLKAKYVDKGSIEVVIPVEGTITMPLVMALVKGSPHKEDAQKYLDWLLTDEAQTLMAESFFQPVIPVKLDAALQAKFPPKGAYAKAKVIPLDQMAAQADSIKKRWETEIEGGR